MPCEFVATHDLVFVLLPIERPEETSRIEIELLDGELVLDTIALGVESDGVVASTHFRNRVEDLMGPSGAWRLCRSLVAEGMALPQGDPAREDVVRKVERVGELLRTQVENLPVGPPQTRRDLIRRLERYLSMLEADLRWRLGVKKR